MLSIEPLLARASSRAAAYVGRKAMTKAQRKMLGAKLAPLISRDTFASFVDQLTPAQAARFDAFVASPQLDHLALQLMSWQLSGRSEATLADLRDGVRHALRSRVELRDEKLITGTDLVMQMLTVATETAMPDVAPSVAGVVPASVMLAAAADVAAAAVRNNELLERVTSLAAVDRFAGALRSQVQRMRSKMRLTHLGNRSAVDYARLHVGPRFRRAGQDETRSITQILDERQRVVVLGDPGAGKSTFAAKLAHDVAGDTVPGLEGRVPFLLLARDLIDVVRTERRPLAALMERAAADPYNVTAPPDAVEYLLLNGLALVIVDGLDEFGDPAARQRLGELVEGFAHMYPTVNVIVTSREVGYSEAPLDPEMFSSWRIAPFDDQQIERYTGNWFGLDGQLPAAEQKELGESFLRESADVADLRSNPLMLSLLCSLYSSKHYIPRRRTEIYEQCAEMLFERWDQHRGITVPLRFASHMRPAVARLAWMMFNDRERGQVVNRDRITEFLIDYMMEERFDVREDAAAAVEEFLDFCAGRAWVLTRVGTEGHRPVYGFTHRTFLEYFAAVQLVRMGPSPGEVWNHLEPHIADGSWRVVSHLAVQLLDRYAEGGASRFVDSLVAVAIASPQRPELLTFGAEVAGQVALRTPTLRALALEAVRLAGERSVNERWRYYGEDRLTDALTVADRPLATLLRQDLPENTGRLTASVVQAFSDPQFDLEDGSVSYGWLCGLMRSKVDPHSSLWLTLQAEMAERGPASSQGWAEVIDMPSAAVVRERGASCLFKTSKFGGTRWVSVAAEAVLETVTDFVPQAERTSEYLRLLDGLYEPIVEDPWPWLRARSGGVSLWYPANEGEFLESQLNLGRFLELTPTQRSVALLLLLPLMQHAEIDLKDPVENVKPFAALLSARKSGWQRKAVIRRVEEWALRRRAHDLVVSWVNNEASPVLRYE